MIVGVVLFWHALDRLFGSLPNAQLAHPRQHPQRYWGPHPLSFVGGEFSEARSWRCCLLCVLAERRLSRFSGRGFRRPYASHMRYPDNLCEPYFVCWNGLKNMPTKAIGYVRVSTDKQADRGVSLEAQVEKIRAMATVHDVELLDVLVDAGESAKDLDRPGMVRILEMVQSRAVGMVIVAKLDRLTRSVKDLAVLLEQFQRRGVSLVSVAESLDTGSASGRLVLNIMVSVSQWEREAIGERTRDAMRHKKAKLEFVGNAPYGYRQAPDKRHVEPEPGEQAILERIHRLRKTGKSLRNADQLNRLKIRTRQGSPWRHEYVARLLKAA